MNKLLIQISIILTLSIPVSAVAQANWNNSSFVHQNGKYILDGNNDTIQLNGVNLGGWLMWEGWIWGGNFTQEKTIYNDIESIVGTTEADDFREAVYDNYITEADIESISNQCHNVVRIPFNHTILEDDFNPYVYKQSGWDRLDSILSWCENHNVYAVLDLHSAPGGQSPLFTSDPDLFINLWNGAINQERTRRLWKAIADRYKDRGIIAGYDLLNEPAAPNDSLLVDIYQGIIDSVRAVDTNHMLFIEGNNYAEDFSMFTAPLDNNMAYEFHFYTWFIFSGQQDSLMHFTTLSDTSGIPIWCGEWGENDYSKLDETKSYFDDPAFGISGSAFWTWKKVIKPGAYPYYNGVDTTSNWNKSITWVGANGNPQPSFTEMSNGMSEFLNQANLQNCFFDQMTNQVLTSCENVGIEDETVQNELLVYPNPVKNVLFFSHQVDMRITDLTGKLVLTAYQVDQIDVSDLANGIYILHSGNGQTIRFVKQ